MIFTTYERIGNVIIEGSGMCDGSLVVMLRVDVVWKLPARVCAAWRDSFTLCSQRWSSGYDSVAV